MNPRHRRLYVLRDTPQQTAARAASIVGTLPHEEVLWIGEEAPAGSAPVHASQASRWLGASMQAVVLDLHRPWRAELLGQTHGLVWGGGALVLRMDVRPAPGERAGSESRFGTRFEAALIRASTSDDETPIGAGIVRPSGSAAQGALVDRLERRLRAPLAQGKPLRGALLADRGRGKSSALGLLLSRLSAWQRPPRVLVSAPSRAAAAEVLRFGSAGGEPPFVEAAELTREPRGLAPELIVIDEAAQLPVPMLRAIVAAHPDVRMLFATTTHGYEGTGRGFVLRFLEALEGLERWSLREPIRWAEGDPVERFVHDALLLDAAPDPLPMALGGADLGARSIEAIGPRAERVRALEVDRDDLLGGERAGGGGLLEALFGLLVHAHYRTTPSDLQQLLDAPNVRVHVLEHEGAIVAATLLAQEGALPPPLVEELLRGRRRLVGQALPETLISHLGHAEAGPLSMIRSVRIATHPEIRRAGLGHILVTHVHERYQPDLFGTLFGATPELIAFRRACGYALIRVGASRGSRTGEPAAVMIRARSAAAERLLGALRAELARDLPTQLELLEAEGSLLFDPRLKGALLSDLPSPAGFDPAAIEAAITGYAHGPRIFESVMPALELAVRARERALSRLRSDEEALIRARVLERQPWTLVAAQQGHANPRITMRALRRAIRALLSLTP